MTPTYYCTYRSSKRGGEIGPPPLALHFSERSLPPPRGSLRYGQSPRCYHNGRNSWTKKYPPIAYHDARNKVSYNVTKRKILNEKLLEEVRICMPPHYCILY